MAQRKDKTKKPNSPRPLQESFEKAKKPAARPSPKKRKAPGSSPSSIASASTAAAAPAAAATQQIEPSRKEQTGFLTYVRMAMSAKSAETSHQASLVNSHYNGLGAKEKRALIVEFHKGGAKKAGLACIFSQVLKVQEAAKSSSWEGYITFDGLCDLHKVIGLA